MILAVVTEFPMLWWTIVDLSDDLDAPRRYSRRFSHGIFASRVVPELDSTAPKKSAQSRMAYV